MSKNPPRAVAEVAKGVTLSPIGRDERVGEVKGDGRGWGSGWMRR